MGKAQHGHRGGSQEWAPTACSIVRMKEGKKEREGESRIHLPPGRTYIIFQHGFSDSMRGDLPWFPYVGKWQKQFSQPLVKFTALSIAQHGGRREVMAIPLVTGVE